MVGALDLQAGHALVRAVAGLGHRGADRGDGEDAATGGDEVSLAVGSGAGVDHLAPLEALDGVHVIQAGTALSGDDLVTAGGRVLAVVGTGPSVAEARDAAYRGVAETHFDGAQYRTDIAAVAGG